VRVTIGPRVLLNRLRLGQHGWLSASVTHGHAIKTSYAWLLGKSGTLPGCMFLSLLFGGVASLNHRLIAVKPSAWELWFGAFGLGRRFGSTQLRFEQQEFRRDALDFPRLVL